MMRAASSPILQLIRRVVNDPRVSCCADQELLRRFLDQQDEAAFETLVRRHGPMVLDVCRSLLQNEADVEDAFQATFLVLARKAGSVRKAASLASWLHGVAYRTACKARTEFARRKEHEARVSASATAEVADDLAWREVRQVVHEELNAVSERYRTPLVLCYLEGKTQDMAASFLGLAKSTLKERLERGRALLRERLVRRGLGPAVVLLASAWPGAASSATAPSALVVSTVKAATAVAAGQTVAGGVISPNVIALTQGVLNTMFFSKLKAIAGTLLVVGLLGVGVAGNFVPTATLPAQPRAAADEEKGQLQEAKQNQLPDAKRILGTWRVVSIEVNGKVNRDPKSPGLSHGPWVITADKIIQEGTHFTEEKGYFKGKSEIPYKLDATKSPKEIDLISTRLDGTDPKSMLGIYALDGDTLKICFPNVDEPRPKEFASKPGSDLVFYVLKRVPPAKDAPQAPKTDAGAGKPVAGGDKEEHKEGNEPEPLELLQPVSGIVSSPDRSLFATIVYRRPKAKERDQPRDATKSGLEVEQDIFATVTVRDAKTGKEMFTTGELKDPRIHRFIFSPDGKTLALSFQRPFGEGFKTDKVELWELKTGNIRRRIELDHGGCMGGLAFSLDGKTLAVTGHPDGGTTGGVRLIDVESGSLKKALKVEKAIHAEAAYSPDGETLASAGSAMDRQEVLLWDLSAGKVKKVLESASEDILSLAFSPDGKRLVGGGADGQLELWDIKTGKATALPSASELTDKVIFSPDGKYLAASGRSQKDGKYVQDAKLWDLATNRLLKSEDDSQVITFNKDGNRLAVLQKSKKIISWDVQKVSPRGEVESRSGAAV